MGSRAEKCGKFESAGRQGLSSGHDFSRAVTDDDSTGFFPLRFGKRDKIASDDLYFKNSWHLLTASVNFNPHHPLSRPGSSNYPAGRPSARFVALSTPPLPSPTMAAPCAPAASVIYFSSTRTPHAQSNTSSFPPARIVKSKSSIAPGATRASGFSTTATSI